MFFSSNVAVISTTDVLFATELALCFLFGAIPTFNVRCIVFDIQIYSFVDPLFISLSLLLWTVCVFYSFVDLCLYLIYAIRLQKILITRDRLLDLK
jgi:hypothetical protein